MMKVADTRRCPLFVVVFVVLVSPAFAQQKEPIGLWVADARMTSAGLPGDPGWVPDLPPNTVTPSRAWGMELGAHVYPLRFRSIALGVGATWLRAKGTYTPPEPTATPPPTTTPPPVQTAPTVETQVTTFAPQLSLNFGHSLGWSYVSVGLGRSRVDSIAMLTGVIIPPRESDSVKTLNYGGGARWFVNDHVGVGFDIRWHKLGLVPASATHPGAGRSSLVMLGAGLVIK